MVVAWALVACLLLARSGATAAADEGAATCSGDGASDPACQAGDEQVQDPSPSFAAEEVEDVAVFDRIGDQSPFKVARRLKCRTDTDPRSIVSYCQEMRPDGLCDFEDTPAPDTGDPEEDAKEKERYTAWRADCLHHCIFDSADLNPFDINDQGTMLIAPLHAAGYRAAVSLDRRALAVSEDLEDCLYVAPLPQIQEMVVRAEAAGSLISGNPKGHRVNYIFHLGVTASTFLARVLEEASDRFFVQREPAVLSWTAKISPGSSTEEISKIFGLAVEPLISRRHAQNQTVVVKAKSSALRFMRAALAQGKRSRAVFLYTGLRTHVTLATLHAGDEKKQAYFPEALMDALEADVPVFEKYKTGNQAYKDLTTPQRMSLAWLKRMFFARSKDIPQKKVLHLSMDKFLASPVAEAQAVAKFFGAKLKKGDTEKRLAGSGVLNMYATEKETPYTHQMHKEILRRRAVKFEGAINEAVTFAKGLVEEHGELLGLRELINV